MDGFHGGSHVMNTKEMGASLQGKGVQDRGSRECLFGGGAEEAPDHRLAGHADHQGIAVEGVY